MSYQKHIFMICSKKRKGSSNFCIVSREIEKKTFNNWEKKAIHKLNTSLKPNFIRYSENYFIITYYSKFELQSSILC